ncbi:MAG: TlpA disulfide reductase family protein, partial [Pseudomonadota bacterium]
MPRFVTRYGLWIMVVGLVAAVVYGLSRAASIDQGGSSLERFAQGSLAGLDFAFAGEIPEMKPFVGPNGTELTLADFRGRIILVNLWGTWCPPCIEEMPTLAALQSSRGGEDFQVVAISLENDDDLERPKAALERLTGGVLEFYASPSF